MEDTNFVPDFRFNDSTILQADGSYPIVCDLMKDEPSPWCLNSKLTLIHFAGICDMTLEFFNDGMVKIVSFRPSNNDPLMNIDLRCLRAWTDANGWGKPVPTKHVINAGIPFWKHMWRVDLVDSPDLDTRYGLRAELETQEGNLRRDDGDPNG